MSYLLELAERVEAAAGPSYLLDRDIAAAIGADWANLGLVAPGYTASLDAAMQLVPSGFGIYTRWSLKGAETRTADAILTTEISTALGQHGYYSAENQVLQVTAATLPLAICAVALRARATLEASPRGDALDHQRTPDDE